MQSRLGDLLSYVTDSAAAEIVKHCEYEVGADPRTREEAMADMVYEVVNISDTVTLDAPSDQVAIACTLVLGGGSYMLRREDGESPQCLLLFAGQDAVDAFLRDTFGTEELGEWMVEHATETAPALESALCSSISERRALLRAFEGLAEDDRRKRLAAFNEESRTSMNDICGRAFALAERIRAKARKAADV